MNIHYNTDIISTNQVGYLAVWYNTKGITRIFSMAEVETLFIVTYDSTSGQDFIIYKDDSLTRHFKISSKGLYFHDTASGGATSKVDATFVETVDDKN